tara:strand:+ start:817 stop:1122 length:306 start_codon:yes stop_codon:yes gene_type:complete
MIIYDQPSANPDPSAQVCDDEFRQLFIKFCSLVCILYHKKLNLANIFLLVLKEDRIKKLYMSICEFDSDYEALKCFLQYDNTLHKSKYIKKYLNSAKKRKK